MSNYVQLSLTKPVFSINKNENAHKFAKQVSFPNDYIVWFHYQYLVTLHVLVRELVKTTILEQDPPLG